MLAWIVATTLLLDNPNPGGLPFPVPQFPQIPVVGTPSPELSAIEHSPDYGDRQDEIESMIDDWSAPITMLNDSLDSFLADVPDASTGDFDTGYSALSDFGSVYDYSEYTGESIGTLAQYARAGQGLVVDLFSTATGLLVDFMLACAVWLMVVKIIIVVIQVIMRLWRIGNEIWNAIFNVVPTGG